MARGERFTRLSTLCILLAGAAPALVSQGTTSSALTGVVRGPSGQPLAGATVRISSPAMIGGEKVTRTSENGSYRFSMLPSGVYRITVESQGLPTLSGQETLELGKTSAVNWRFRAAAAATVEVVDQATSADKEAVGVSTNLTAEVLANVPLGRDLTQVAALTPGVNVTDTTSGAGIKAWGGDIFGNAYTIDGLNVGDSKSGEKWVYANPDWFSDVTVGGIGAPAEFGGFSGAYINGVVRKGGNTLEGTFSAYYQKNSWAALLDNDRLSANERELYDGVYSSYSAGVGGPIITDKLWYYVSAEAISDSAQDSPVGSLYPVKLSNPRFLGKVTWQALPSATWDAFLEYDAVNRENRYVTYLYEKNATQKQKSPSVLFTTSWTQAFGQSVMTLRYSGLHARDDRSSYNPTGYTIEANAALTPGVMTPAGLSEVAYPELIGKRYWGNVRRTNLLRENLRGRNTLSGTLDLFGTGVLTSSDSHAVRMGFEFEQSKNEEKRWIASPNGIAYRTRMRSSSGVLGLRPYRAVTGAGREVSTDMERLTFFIQDTWTVNSRFQIRPGIRFESNKGGAESGGTLWSTRTLAPRLGFTFNVTENQSQVAKLHFGRYYTAMSSDYFQRAIPGVYQNTNVFYWGSSTNLVDPYRPNLIPVDTTVGLLGADWAYSYNFNVSTLDPSHKQPYTDEAVFNYDIQIGNQWSFGVTGVYRAKKDILVQNDPGWNDPAYTAGTLAVTSPLTGHTYTTYISDIVLSDPTPVAQGGGDHRFLITNSAEAKNHYRMLTVSAMRAMANGWSFTGSFTWSKAEGNYSDSAAQALENFNDPNAQINNYGRLPYVNDREARLRGVYEFPWAWKTRLSATFTYLSGERYTPTIDMVSNVFELNQNSMTINAAPLGSATYPSRRLLDLRFSQELPIARLVKAELFLDVFNLLNKATSTDYGDADVGRAAYVADFDPNTPGVAMLIPNGYYQKPIYVDAPRRVQLGFKLKF